MRSSKIIDRFSVKRALAILTALIFCGSGLSQTNEETLNLESLGLGDDSGSSVTSGSKDIIVEIIGGLPLARTVIRFQDKEIMVHLMFDPSLVEPFMIHESSLNGLGLNPAVAPGQRVEIDFGNNVRLTDIPIACARLRPLEEHTRVFAAELDETPVVGYFGPAAFSNNVIELDMAKGLLRTMGLASDQAREVEVSYSRTNTDYGITVEGTGPGSVPLNILLSTRTHDSGLAPAFLKKAREQKVAPNFIMVGKVDWGQRSALRFDPLEEWWPGTVNAYIGADAMSNAVVTIWPKRKKIALQPGPVSTFSESEQGYFLALADQNPDTVRRFIESSPRRRLQDDACLRLCDLVLLDPEKNEKDSKQALDILADHYRPERRSVTLLNIADTVETSGHKFGEVLVEHALELSIREAPKAVEQTAVHDVHVRIGRRALEKGELQLARRHLLSAAFGMPRDAECNFWLGEFYRRNKQLRRAWSRYFQVLLDEKLEMDDPIRADSLDQLKRLNNTPEFRKDFDMVEAEEYMTGRLATAEFHAQTRYRYLKKHKPHRVRMVELFIDPSEETGGGMELAFQALDEFFEGELVLAAYHLGGPMGISVARDRLAGYQKTSGPLIVIDGVPMFETALGKGEKPGEDATLHYPQLRNATLPKTAPEDSVWVINGEVERDDQKLTGSISIEGEAKSDGLSLVVLLCERSVMAVEKNNVFFHHFVVRDQLTPNDGLSLNKAIEGKFDVKVDFARLRKKVTLPGGAPPFVDPDQLFLVAFIQRGRDSRVLSATQITFPDSK